MRRSRHTSEVKYCQKSYRLDGHKIGGVVTGEATMNDSLPGAVGICSGSFSRAALEERIGGKSDSGRQDSK
jgi:hypothetical protein